MRAIATLEHTRFHPGAIAEALNYWARFVRGPARAIATYRDEADLYPCCSGHNPESIRGDLFVALHALPAKAARELRALVRPLDELYLSRSIPNGYDDHLRSLLS